MRRYLIAAAIIIFTIITAGWFTTGYLGNLARTHVIEHASANLSAISFHLTDEMKKIEGAVETLAGSPWISPALISRNDQNTERANSVLDRYNSAMIASVTYLMDVHGTTIASSNRKAQESFVGKSYRFRTYFTEAMRGKPGRYFAVGVTTGKKGFYASFPVKDHSGRIVGVTVIKKDLDEIEKVLGVYSHCFLVNEDGVIFLSGKAEFSLKTLWPVDGDRKNALMASQQFGTGPFEAVLSTPPEDGATVVIDKQSLLVARKSIGEGEWSLIYLIPANIITVYRLFGIISTVFLCILIGGFILLLSIRERSSLSIRQGAELLKEERNKAQKYLEIAGVMIVVIDGSQNVTLINKQGCDILGYDENEILGKNWFDHFIPERERDSVKIIFEELMMTGEIEPYAHVEGFVLTKGGGKRLIAWHNTILCDEDGNITDTLSSGQDITERREAEEEIKRLNQQIEFILGATKTGLDIIDSEFNIRYIDSEWKKVYGNPEGRKCYEYFMDRKEICPGCGIVTALATKEIAVTEELLVKEGNRPIQVTTIPFQDSKGEWMVAEVNADISERKKAEEIINQMAYHDALTGLPNRRLFNDRLCVALEHAKRFRRKLSIMILDLDNFKDVNDTWGHNVGDLLLVKAGNLLTDTLRASDTVARMGGDEFLLLLAENAGEEDASRAAERILRAFRKPVVCDGHPLSITTSIGIAIYPDHGEDIETLGKHADTALYLAKEQGRDRYCLYAPIHTS